MKKIIILLIALFSLYVNIFASNNSSTPITTITWNEYLHIQSKSQIISETDEKYVIIFNGNVIEVLLEK